MKLVINSYFKPNARYNHPKYIVIVLRGIRREGRCYIRLVHGMLQGQVIVNELMTLRVSKKGAVFFD